jgi:hypothetical protein
VVLVKDERERGTHMLAVIARRSRCSFCFLNPVLLAFKDS